jgi:hypothetical protein
MNVAYSGNVVLCVLPFDGGNKTDELSEKEAYDAYREAYEACHQPLVTFPLAATATRHYIPCICQGHLQVYFYVG